MEPSFAERLSRLDISLFDSIPSQTSGPDRRALLATQRVFHARGAYTYLEVGSHLGGSLQVYHLDPACNSIQSIDPRPNAQADARLGGSYHYRGNSSERMRKLLGRIDSAGLEKLTCHDCDLASYARGPHPASADLVFIDAEHTPEAMLRDLELALGLSPRPEVVLMHDVEALAGSEKRLAELATAHERVVRLVSPSLLAISTESFFNELAEIDPQPLGELAQLGGNEETAPLVTAGPGIVVATTLGADPNALIEQLVKRHAGWFDAGALDPSLTESPSELTRGDSAGDAWPVFREFFTPHLHSFSAARSRGLRMVFLLPPAELLLNTLGEQPEFPHAESWAAVCEYLIPRLHSLVDEAQSAGRHGPVLCVFGPVSEVDFSAIDSALAKGGNATVGTPSPLPDILSAPVLSTRAIDRLGPFPDQQWVTLHEVFEFTYNMVALACAKPSTAE